MHILIEKDGKTMVESADLDDVRAALKDQETLPWVDHRHCRIALGGILGIPFHPLRRNQKRSRPFRHYHRDSLHYHRGTADPARFAAQQ